MTDYVYVIATVQVGRPGRPIKIGVTSNPDKRLSQLRTAAPFPIDIVCVFEMPTREIALGIEAIFHDRHALQRTHGEWFDINLTEAVSEICEDYDAFLHFAWCSEGGISKQQLWEMRNRTGLYAAEQKVAAERYLRAWEQADGQ